MRTKQFWTLFSTVCLSLLCMAETNQTTKNQPKAPITLVKKNRGASTIRPKAPDRQVVTCAYEEEELYFSFVIPEGMATVTVKDENLFSLTYEIDTAPLEVYIPVGELTGDINVELETEKGNFYSGTIEISY